LQMGLFLGEVALSTFLIVRFTLHNRSEGLAIVAPIAKTEAKKRTMIRRLVIIGWIAGIPTIAETWIGGFQYFYQWGRGQNSSSIFIHFMGFSASKAKIFSLHFWTSCRRIYYGTTYNVFYGLTYMKGA
jgi:hypothetical protein